MPSNVIAKAVGEIRITTSQLEAGLKCLTKCFLLSHGEQGSAMLTPTGPALIMSLTKLRRSNA